MIRLASIAAIIGAILLFVASTCRNGDVVAPTDQRVETVSRETPQQQKEDLGPVTVPVAGVAVHQLVNSWHDARDNGARVHEALDIPAPAGTPVNAAMAGKVEKLFVSKAGGLTVYVRSMDTKWIAYYAHLQRYADGLTEGQRVEQGSTIGFVGDTGNSGVGNNHLHFALARMQPGERWFQGEPVNPYPLLAAKAPKR